jgi:hypothetical protein
LSGGAAAVVAAALARDLCSWVQVLGNLLALPPDEPDHGATAPAAAFANEAGGMPNGGSFGGGGGGATVRRLSVQWPAGVGGGSRVPRPVLAALEVAVRRSDDAPSGSGGPSIGGASKSSSSSSCERSPYVRVGPTAVKRSSRPSAVHLAPPASWVEARSLEPGRCYTVGQMPPEPLRSRSGGARRYLVDSPFLVVVVVVIL